MPSFIDIHTHSATGPADPSGFFLRNVIVAKDQMNNNPCSAGIHPWYIQQSGTAQLATLRAMIRTNPHIIAVGECGLDKVTQTDLPTQEAVFVGQLALAIEFEKPVIVHCVRAYQEIIQLIKQSKIKKPVIIHGYDKSIELAKQLLLQNFYLSLGDSILTGYQDQLIREIPLDRIFLETDTSSVSISEIYTYFCRVRNLSVSDLQIQISANFDVVFKSYFKL